MRYVLYPKTVTALVCGRRFKAPPRSAAPAPTGGVSGRQRHMRRAVAAVKKGAAFRSCSGHLPCARHPQERSTNTARNITADKDKPPPPGSASALGGLDPNRGSAAAAHGRTIVTSWLANPRCRASAPLCGRGALRRSAEEGDARLLAELGRRRAVVLLLQVRLLVKRLGEEREQLLQDGCVAALRRFVCVHQHPLARDVLGRGCLHLRHPFRVTSTIRLQARRVQCYPAQPLVTSLRCSSLAVKRALQLLEQSL
mmetsp:Transcript_25905/g.60458  ORF Transcript_25905/g.60458 Transcript_25905/m.60458 type:complete len:255 (-) Transcript_25905:1387-2151(-)